MLSAQCDCQFHITRGFIDGMCIELTLCDREQLPKMDEKNEGYQVDEAGVTIVQEGYAVPDMDVNQLQFLCSVISLWRL